MDVENWCPTIGANTVGVVRSAETMEFGGLFQVNRVVQEGVCCGELDQTTTASDMSSPCRSLTIGECARPQNTAGQPYDPPPELEDTDWVYNLCFFRRCDPDNPFDVDVFTPFAGKINCESFQVTIPCRCWRQNLRSPERSR